MPLYEHHCRACEKDWREYHTLEDFEAARTIGCPKCESNDTYICVTTSGAVHFKGGGWSPQGYSKDTAYEQWGSDNVTVYDRKEDCERVMKGEAKEAEHRKLKRLDKAAKRHLGPDAALTQEQADKAITRAGEDVKV